MTSTDPSTSEQSRDDDPVEERNPLLLPPRRETVELYRPGVEEHLETIVEEIEKLEAARLAGGGPPRKQGRKDRAAVLAEEHDQLVAEQATLKLTFVEPAYDAYAGLYEQHPPREGHRVDQRIGYNPDTYSTALARLCLVDPIVTDEQWAEFRSSVTAFNWNKITATVNALVNKEPDLPKPLAVSALQRRREHASKQQHDTASHRGGSRE